MQLHNFIIHMNGTDAVSMDKQFNNIYHLAAQLETAIRQAWPHMRDYYTLGDSAESSRTADVIVAREHLLNVEKVQEWALDGLATIQQQEG